MFKKILAALGTVLLAGSLSVVAVAAPASAHTADAKPTVACETNGTYTVTWTYKQTNTPSSGQGSQTDVKVISHSSGTLSSDADTGEAQPQIFLNEALDHAANGKSTQHRLGNWTQTFTQSGIPGTSTFASVGIQTDWLGWGSAETDRRVVLDGTCKAPTSETAVASVSTTPGTCTAPGSVAFAITNATWDDSGDITDGSRNATANDGFAFTGGATTMVVTYSIPGPNTSLCPVNQKCTTIATGPVSTNLNDLWHDIDTRATGHVQYVSGALHVYTEGTTSTDKVSEGMSANFPLSDVGSLKIDTTKIGGSSVNGPGINLFVTFASGQTGTLVYEPVYGQDLWLTGGSNAAVQANAPVIGGGNGSQWHGTIDQWLTRYPDAVVSGFAYSLGSGVFWDGTINSITVGCTNYTFDFATGVQPDPITRDTVSEQVVCGDKQVDITTTTYVTKYVFDVAENSWVLGDEDAGTAVVTQRDLTADEKAENCGVVIGTDPTASSCDVTNADAPFSSWIRVTLDDKVVYTIDDKVVTSEYTAEPAGTYTVKAVAADGYVLQPEAEKTWELTVRDSKKCDPNLPTEALVYPTFSSTPLTCTADGSYTIGEVTKGTVTWTVNGTPTLPGTYSVSSAQNVTLVASPTNPKDGLGEFAQPGTVSFTEPTGSCDPPTLAVVTPTYSSTQPTCNAGGSFTIGALEAGTVSWTVNGDPQKPGVYKVGSGTYALVAVPSNDQDGLDPDWANVTVAIGAAPAGCNLPTLAYTGLATGGGLTLAGGLLFVGLAGLFVARRRTAAE